MLLAELIYWREQCRILNRIVWLNDIQPFNVGIFLQKFLHFDTYLRPQFLPYTSTPTDLRSQILSHPINPFAFLKLVATPVLADSWLRRAEQVLLATPLKANFYLKKCLMVLRCFKLYYCFPDFTVIVKPY